MRGIGREVAGIAMAAVGAVALEVGTFLLDNMAASLLMNGLLLVTGGLVLMRHDRDQEEPDQ